ncbi:MAG: dephospho-CoA kinase [Oscillospiraceae bacterium]|nr:dephospho-CoA kinase [Oscillospiraceae bacterium]
MHGKIIGLTGPSGSGKSTVGAYLTKTAGIPVVDCDKIAREVVKKGSPVLAELASVFGGGIIAPGGELDRIRLAETAFSSPENTAKLGAVTHPAIIKISFDDAENFLKNGAKAVIIDAAALFESEAHKKCDYTAAVIAPEKIRLERITSRDGISKERALQRMNAQRDSGFYTEKADFTVRNYPPFVLEEELKPLFEMIE